FQRVLHSLPGGFSAMLRLTTVLALAFAGIVSAADPPVPQPGNSDSLKAATDLKPVMDRLERISQEVKSRDEDFKKIMLLMTESLDRLQRDLAELRGRVDALAANPVTARKPGPEMGQGQATVQLVNAHPFMEMTAQVNGGVFTVEPGRTLTVP